jgi:hypothetical protein
MLKHVLKGSLSMAVAATCLVAQPAQAAMSCWNQQNMAAAKIRDLQSRLMVATMRCHAMGVDVLPAYNDFVRSNRSTIQAANGLIKAQFAQGFGSNAQNEYDRFTTRLANAYGADATNVAICQQTAARAREAVAANGDLDRLLRIAEAMGPVPQLPGGECKISFAEAGR